MKIPTDQKCILVTGAASGIGLATARFFAEKGWYIGGYDINEEGLRALERELGEESCITAVLDVSDRENFASRLSQFSSITSGRLDLLFNNAGIGAAVRFDEQSFEGLMKIINVNLIGVINGIHLSVDLLKATPNSLCFTTASATSIFGMPGHAVYSASKHAVRGLTEALSIEFDLFGVRVADVLPGVIDTAILGEEKKSSAASEGMFRLISPIEIARTAWAAYHDSQRRLHWFVPDELKEFEAASALDPEGTRAQLVEAGLTRG